MNTSRSACSCATQQGSNFNASKVSQIKNGVTIKADLVALFGQPNLQGTDLAENPTLDWRYVKVQTKAHTFVPVVGFFAGGANVEQKNLHVILSPRGTVKAFTTNAGRQSSGL
ncbi:MAG: hypothetical protein ACFUZC_21475 [Chthoniobacteraceae bacterium]